jgi:hypothetical protein
VSASSTCFLVDTTLAGFNTFTVALVSAGTGSTDGFVFAQATRNDTDPTKILRRTDRAIALLTI